MVNKNNLYHGHNDDDVDYQEKYLGERRAGFGWVDVLGCPDKKGVFRYRGRQHKRYVVPLPLYSLGLYCIVPLRDLDKRKREERREMLGDGKPLIPST